MRGTKIVCTVGPASEGRLPELIAAGMDVVRVNFSHGTADTRRRAVEAVRSAEAAAGRPIAVLADLPGPKVRLGDVPDGTTEVAAGSRFTFVATTRAGDAARGPRPDGPYASTTHAELAGDVRPGDRIFLADGAVELEVEHTREGDVITRVVRGGTIRSRAGVSVPSERLSLPAVTPRDRAALDEATDIGADLVAQSFVRSAADIESLRALMRDRRIPVVAKIETRSAVEDADAILATADAVMIARGDLGVQLPFEHVPMVQKRLVAEAAKRGVACIVATQMLESMIAAPRPTRAEASDVANAVLEGADAILLSAETAVGRFPVDAVDAAARIIRAAEMGLQPRSASSHVGPADPRGTAIAEAAVALAARLPEVVAIACYTASGVTAERLSAARPRVPIVAFSPDAQVVRRLTLRRAVMAYQSDAPADVDDLIGLVDRRLLEVGVASAGSSVLVVAGPRPRAGEPDRADRPADLLTVHVVGS